VKGEEKLADKRERAVQEVKRVDQGVMRDQKAYPVYLTKKCHDLFTTLLEKHKQRM